MIPTTISDNPMRDMSAVMAKARKMTDWQLADVLAGKDLSVPQIAAMSEAMGRKQLREAMQAQQAKQQAQQPSVKDQLLAEEQAAANPQQAQQPQRAQQPKLLSAGGIAALPAPNMEGMGEGMAAGGIVAFGNGGDVQHFYNQGAVNLDDEEYLKATDPTAYARQKRQSDAWARISDSGRPYSVAEFREDVVDPIKNFFTSPWDKADAAKAEKAEIAKIMKEKNISLEDAVRIRGIQKQVGDKEGDYQMYTPKPVNYAATPSAAAANPNAPTTGGGKPSGGKPDSGLPAIDISKPTTFERRANPYEGMSAEKVDMEGLKDKGLGEGLMRASQMILSKPRLSEAIGAGLGALADQGLATRKEINAAKKDARDYDLLLAKSKEAFEQGQDQLGFHYDELAEKKRHNPIMEQAALITANAHMKSAQGKENAPDAQMIKLAYEHLDKQLRDNIQFRQKFNQLSPDEQMQYIAALATQNKNIYTGMQSPGKSGAPVKFLGFES